MPNTQTLISNSTYKTIIFDFFGVISSRVMQTWFVDNFGDSQKTKEEFEHYALLQDLGKMSQQEVYEKLAQSTGKSTETISDEMDPYLTLNHHLIEYINRIKGKGYKIAILSNASNDFFEDKIYPKYPWLKDLFEEIIISSNVELVKPGKEIYDLALNKLKTKAEETIFIDDSLVNVSGAEKVGIKSLLFTDLEKLIKDLSELGVSI